MIEIERREDQAGPYDERFVNGAPPVGAKYRVIRDEWDLDGPVPLRTIHEVELVSTE